MYAIHRWFTWKQTPRLNSAGMTTPATKDTETARSVKRSCLSHPPFHSSKCGVGLGHRSLATACTPLCSASDDHGCRSNQPDDVSLPGCHACCKRFSWASAALTDWGHLGCQGVNSPGTGFEPEIAACHFLSLLFTHSLKPLGRVCTRNRLLF